MHTLAICFENTDEASGARWRLCEAISERAARIRLLPKGAAIAIVSRVAPSPSTSVVACLEGPAW